MTDWKTVALGEVCTLQRGMDLPKRLRNEGEFPLVTSSGIDGAHSIGPVKGPGVITGRYGTIGKVFFVESDFWPLNTTLYVRDFHGNDARFVHYLLQAVDLHSHSGKSGVPGVNRNDVHQEFVCVPADRPEQESIAQTLLDADALIDSLEQLLTKKRQIKQGAMQELLTGKRRLPGFSDVWTDGVLGDVVAELVAGVSVNSDPTESGIGVPSVVKTSALKGGSFDPYECKPIIQTDLARAKTPLSQNTLLISRMNTPDLVGEVGYVDKAFDWLYLPDRIWMTRMRSPDCVCVQWLGYVLSSKPYKRRIGDTATGTSGSMKNIAKGALLGVSMSFPEVAEQRAITTILSEMDTEITAIEARLTKARALKQGMAQALLTGRIRLLEPTA